jgi:hypothetical protein
MFCMHSGVTGKWSPIAHTLREYILQRLLVVPSGSAYAEVHRTCDPGMQMIIVGKWLFHSRYGHACIE